ncbi:hypothetical protein EB796_002501 [Bugula neritina]|uniref:Uncharacterized protein n=1 Tax=Bugula neritina TaxID=10212 RepID=A0A7J7KM15_BUGNE|nr:hypothetical protein EB796_002501 [Bugula neritina]
MLSYRDLFGSAEEANGETIRRIIDSDDEDDPLPAKRAKVETESPSNLLLNTNPPSTSKSLPHKKAQSTKLNLSNLVRLKKPEKSNNPTLTTNSCSAITSTKQGTNDSNACTSKTDDTTSTNSTANDSHIANSNPSSSGIQQVKPIGALGMLGDYIYSSESGSDNE